MKRSLKSNFMKVLLLSGLVLAFQFTVFSFSCIAQQNEQVKITVNADHADWIYQPGQPVTFTVAVTRGDQSLKGLKVNYKIGLERMSPVKEGVLLVEKAEETIVGGSLDKPGFLRCLVTATIDGKDYKGMATVGFSPESIKPTTNMPKDFYRFWNEAKIAAAKIPMDAKMKLVPDKCTELVNVYEVDFQNYKQGSRIYGMLSMPKKAGKYPALLRVPGAGVRRYAADTEMAQKGMVVLQIGIHGIPVNMADSVYLKLAAGSLSGYQKFNNDNRDEYYFKRVFMGCIRANDFLCSLPEVDGKKLAVAGGSQGGALTIVTAALDQRVKYIVAYFPAMCDQVGYLYGRTGGWPHAFYETDKVSKAQIETSKYYDVVNFASLLKVPGFYSWGFNDEICPATSSYAAYNLIKAPKELLIVKESGHEYKPIQNIKMKSWLEEKLVTGK